MTNQAPRYGHYEDFTAATTDLFFKVRQQLNNSLAIFSLENAAFIESVAYYLAEASMLAANHLGFHDLNDDEQELAVRNAIHSCLELHESATKGRKITLRKREIEPQLEMSGDVFVELIDGATVFYSTQRPGSHAPGAGAVYCTLQIKSLLAAKRVKRSSPKRRKVESVGIRA